MGRGQGSEVVGGRARACYGPACNQLDQTPVEQPIADDQWLDIAGDLGVCPLHSGERGAEAGPGGRERVYAWHRVSRSPCAA